MRTRIFLTAFLFFLVPSACNPFQTADGELHSISLTTKQAGFAQAGHSFDFKLVQQVSACSQGESWAVSPISMQFLLGMLLNGARGDVAEQICQALGYGRDEMDEVNAYLHLMMKELAGMKSGSRLSFANAFFADKQIPVEPAWKKTTQKYYSAFVENLEMANSLQATLRINRWCKDKTDDKIGNILDENTTYWAALLNALYFYGEWEEQFLLSETGQHFFRLETGTDICVDMMKMEGKSVLCSENDYCQLAKLPYKNGQFSMVVLLPKEGIAIGELIRQLDSEEWSLLNAGGHRVSLDLWLPRFETSCSIEMKGVLQGMGIQFAEGDFAAISAHFPGFDIIKQNTFITVKEQGTETAAVSAALLSTGIPHFTEFRADHPFLYFILEETTGTILMAGCYTGIS